MGTRSLTFVYDNDSTAKSNRVMCLYRQFDGYPSGHGQDLFDFISKGKMVNGYGSKDEPQFNGMGCFAAQLVAHMKDGVGKFYLFPTNATDAGQEYEYHVYFLKGVFWIKVMDCNGCLFEGGLEAFEQFCKSDD